MSTGKRLLISICCVLIGSEIILQRFYQQSVSFEYQQNAPLAVSDSILGHSYRPNSWAYEYGPEYDVTYQINPRGLRDHSPHPIPKPDSLFRILLIGDSFTFGHANNYDAIWPVRLKEQLAKSAPVDIVKAGVQGYNTTQEVLFMEQLIDTYRPDLVLHTYLPNDLVANLPIPEHPNTQKVSLNPLTPELEHNNEPWLELPILFRRLMFQSDWIYTTIYPLKPDFHYFVDPGNPEVQQQLQITKELFNRAAALADSHQIQYQVHFLPQQYQVLATASTHNPAKNRVYTVDRNLMRYLSSQQINCFSTLDTLAAHYRLHNNPLFYRLDGHLTPTGNKIIADRIASILEQQFIQ